MNIVQRRVAVESKNPRASSIAFLISGAVVAMILFLFTHEDQFSFPLHIPALITLAIATIAYGIFERGRFAAAKMLDASIFTTVINISIVVTFLCSILFLSEAVTLQNLFGVLLIFIALLLVSYAKSKIPLSKKGILYTCIISVFLGIAWVMDKKATLYFDPGLYALLMWTLPILIIAPPSLPLTQVRKEFQSAGKGIVFMATLNVLGYFCQLRALSLADATLVMPLIQLSTLTTVIAGILILKETENIPKKIFAGVLALLGAYLLL